tara:strand:+ start:79 stop:630 length:552 start_codon:yes stop_codon:yes gene_type:complete
MQQTNNQIIAAFKKGDRKAQMQLYDNYCNAMFAIACRYLKNEEDAKDAMQEGFIKAFSKIHSYEPNSEFGAWLKRIVINQCLDVLKKEKLEFQPLNDEVMTMESKTDWHFEDTLNKNDILNAMESLPTKYKVTVQLYLIEGYDHLEISEILDIPIKTSRTHLRRGRLKLQELLTAKKYVNEKF